MLSCIARWSCACWAVSCLTAGLSPSASAADWGDLTARFVYDGTAPTPKPAAITRDQAFCGKFKIVDESLVVNKNNGGVRDVIVYLYLSRGQNKPAVHPSFAAQKEVTLDNTGCRFSPRIALVRTDQSLIVKNSDQVGHNTNFTTFSNPAKNILIPAGGKLKLDFKVEERLPSKVSCNIHPWMGGWMLVKDHPYMASSDVDGKLELKNLPAGKWTFQFWQEKSGYVADAKINGKTWKRGRVEVTIKPGVNDLGEIKLPPSMFKD